MTSPDADPRAELMNQVQAFRLSRAIQVAAKLGIADHLRDGPKSADDLAATTESHSPALYRLLRSLAAEGVFEELPGRTFALNEKAQLLRSDVPASLQAWAEFNGSESMWQGWGNLNYSVQTGKSGVERAVGMNIWDYREKNPAEGMLFDRSMTSLTGALATAVARAYDWGQFGVIADVAGGQGALLASILSAHPNPRGILFDQPHVVNGAKAVLQAEGVAGRCEVVAGSFFDSVPKADAYILKHILHDWSDEDSARILQTIRRSAPDAARLLIVEQIIQGPNEGAEGKSMDLQMLVGPGGMERTREEFDALLARGSWRLMATHPAATHHVIEAAPAGRVE